ncbi:MAG TPA: hypothetical protein VFR85_00970 [Anaeromyxobacteraceae bacterium]|nr:hypothetical protein [Anaeromyxobacteraceae bacterium]
MRASIKRAGAARSPRERSAKLLRVLVMGGAVLATACASAPKAGQAPATAGADQQAPSQGGSAPDQKPSGGGVSGW